MAKIKRIPWNKGYTKKTHQSVAKISQTMKHKKIDNFAKWREKMRKQGKWSYLAFSKNGDTAELIGVVLGDGHIEKLPRTESLTIDSNANNLGFVDRYTKLIEVLFGKKPSITKRKDANCIRLRIYQNNISQRLRIPCGSRTSIKNEIPEWIRSSQEYLIRCLRGLYEAEGSFSVHKPTYTYKFIFSNRNKSLLDFVYLSLKSLGFHSHRTEYNIQISRREEVYQCMDLVEFRKY